MRSAEIDDTASTSPNESSRGGLRIVAAPLGATIQDAGRTGWLHAGVPPSGPLDATAHAAANLAVGNDPRDAALEIPLGALRATALAELDVSIDGEPTRRVGRGDELVVAPCARAVRYLAVAGGFAVPLVLGSRSTLLVAALGGFHGRALHPGDELPVSELDIHRAPCAPPGLHAAPRAAPSLNDPPDPAELRVRPGPHIAVLPAQALDQLLARKWRVSPRSDRVGVRLEGGAISRSGDDRGPPAPMVRGAIQITTDGTPIVLGPDHPVTGGYPVLAVMGRTSQALLARLRPGRTVHIVLETG